MRSKKQWKTLTTPQADQKQDALVKGAVRGNVNRQHRIHPKPQLLSWVLLCGTGVKARR
jgi:hypothetical protein